MILNLKLINFRNFDDKIFNNFDDKNIIIWENWKWKTNILESISILWNNSILWLNFENLVKKWEDFFFLEYKNHSNDIIWISYSKIDNKKTYFINKKKVSRKVFVNSTFCVVIFSPIIMNLMYLSPSLRRDFLDNILWNSIPEYNDIFKKYKKILKNRNLVLKNIFLKRCNKSEIVFWDNQFIKIASDIYYYRYKLVNFFIKHINWALEYFNEKINNIDFKYHSIISENNINEELKNSLINNFDKDIILCKTSIWPHVDDFDVLLDWISLINYASRWETKSLIIWLKLLETVFIEKNTEKKPVLIIDDLLSELDTVHKNLLLNKIKYYQTFISSIKIIDNNNIIKI